MKARIAWLVLLTLTSPLTVSAVCLNPKTLVSGYKIPLETEVRTAEGIVVGRVLSEQGLQEDPTDPDGYTAYNMIVRVQVSLKGNLRNIIVIRSENDSSRYPMSVGEEHILFISRDRHGLWVDSCGNSAAMPEGRQLVKPIEAELQKLR